jgi:hypothetical protein
MMQVIISGYNPQARVNPNDVVITINCTDECKQDMRWIKFESDTCSLKR